MRLTINRKIQIFTLFQKDGLKKLIKKENSILYFDCEENKYLKENKDKRIMN